MARQFSQVRFIVLINKALLIRTGSSGAIYFTSWAMGMRYQSLDGSGSYVTGLLDPAPNKPASLLDSSGNIFSRSRPQYEDNPSFVIATANGISNDGTGDQSAAINTLLSSNVGTPIFFPAGIYQVQSTVSVPVGSILVGEGWSQASCSKLEFDKLPC